MRWEVEGDREKRKRGERVGVYTEVKKRGKKEKGEREGGRRDQQDQPDGIDDHQLAELKHVSENKLLVRVGEGRMLGADGDQLAENLDQTVVEHEGGHFLHHLKEL